MNPFKKVRRVAHPINPTEIANRVLNDVEKQLPGRINDALAGAEKQVEELVKAILAELIKPVQQKALEAALLALKSWRSAIRKAVEKNPKLKKDLNTPIPVLTLSLGVGMTFHWAKFYDRADDIIKAIEGYHAAGGVKISRKEILRFIRDIGPDQIDFDAGVKLALGIGIQASGGVWSIPTHLAELVLDEILKDLGVPE